MSNVKPASGRPVAQLDFIRKIGELEAENLRAFRRLAPGAGPLECLFSVPKSGT